MNNINLLESVQRGDGSGRRSFRVGKSLVVPAIVLVAIFLIWGGAKFYAYSLDQQKAEIDKENKRELSALSGKNVDRVVNFDERLKKSADEISNREDYNNFLKDLENSMVAGVRVDSFKYSSEKIELSLTADNFKNVARQILGLKNSNYFKDLTMDKTTKDENGNIKFTLKK